MWSSRVRQCFREFDYTGSRKINRVHIGASTNTRTATRQYVLWEQVKVPVTRYHFITPLLAHLTYSIPTEEVSNILVTCVVLRVSMDDVTTYSLIGFVFRAATKLIIVRDDAMTVDEAVLGQRLGATLGNGDHAGRGRIEHDTLGDHFAWRAAGSHRKRFESVCERIEKNRLLKPLRHIYWYVAPDVRRMRWIYDGRSVPRPCITCECNPASDRT
ncbi:hypothetical protein EVAR_62683_1 [Eumeta japonica]|uniref:Uncharacterized protein n=1 Tax=Eumeta variegata TaxID=151549 RepID=A0A4C1ZZT2_EUMVA|nr:hypothetical protein EVAR_62683_1 [Eumeta japonica]